MGDVKALIEQEAIAKIRAIAKNEIAMLCTFLGDQAMRTRPMSTLRIDGNGTLWFFCKKDSGEAREIEKNAKVQLIYSVPNKTEFLSVEGKATISQDRKKIEELWSPICKTWFNKGKDDPELTVIKVEPVGGHYWDTKHGKMVALAAIAIGALTGKQLDDGIEGELKV